MLLEKLSASCHILQKMTHPIRSNGLLVLMVTASKKTSKYP